MKILAFNGSPRMTNGVTDRVLQKFMEGAKDAGAETEIIYPAKENIKFCAGCFSCWIIHPGKCIHKDDMPIIIKKFKEADTIVFASLVYVDGITAQLKKLIDRLITASSPFIEERDGHQRHPNSDDNNATKIAFISTSGFGETDNFDPLIHHIEAMAKNMESEFVGSLLRPMAPGMEDFYNPDPEIVELILNSFKQAGHDLVTKGKISEDIKKACSTPLFTMEEFQRRANDMFERFIKKANKVNA